MSEKFETLGYYNGHYDEIDRMTIPINDRVCWFGDGVYDVTYCRNYKIYTLKDHIDRFFSSAKQLDIKIPVSYDELCDLLERLVRLLRSDEQMIYWQVTRGTEPRNHIYPENTPGNLWVMLRPIPVKNTYSEIRLITVEDTRFYHCNIKTVNLLPNVMASQNAKRAGADEAVFHRGDRVTECAHSNVSIIKDGIFITPPTDNLILPGIARKNLLRFCAENGIRCAERAFTVNEMMDADEVIVSSSGSFCLRASEIDGKKVGGRAPDILKKLQDTAVADFMKATENK